MAKQGVRCVSNIALIVALGFFSTAQAQTIRVDAAPDHATNFFIPTQALARASIAFHPQLPRSFFSTCTGCCALCRMANRHLPAKYRAFCGGLALEPARHVEPTPR